MWRRVATCPANCQRPVQKWMSLKFSCCHGEKNSSHFRGPFSRYHLNYPNLVACFSATWEILVIFIIFLIEKATKSKLLLHFFLSDAAHERYVWWSACARFTWIMEMPWMCFAFFCTLLRSEAKRFLKDLRSNSRIFRLKKNAWLTTDLISLCS